MNFKYYSNQIFNLIIFLFRLFTLFFIHQNKFAKFKNPNLIIIFITQYIILS